MRQCLIERCLSFPETNVIVTRYFCWLPRNMHVINSRMVEHDFLQYDLTSMFVFALRQHAINRFAAIRVLFHDLTIVGLFKVHRS